MNPAQEDTSRMDLIRYRLWLYTHRPDRVTGFKYAPDGPLRMLDCSVCGHAFEQGVPWQKRCDNCVKVPAHGLDGWGVDVDEACYEASFRHWRGQSLNILSSAWSPPEGAGTVDSFSRKRKDAWKKLEKPLPPRKPRDRRSRQQTR